MSRTEDHEEEEEIYSYEEEEDIIEKSEIFNRELSLRVKKPKMRKVDICEYVIKINCTKRNTKLDELAITMTRNADIFYLIEVIYNKSSFNELCKENHLTISFDEFMEAILSMLDNALKESKETQITFYPEADGGRLEFSDVLELKAVEIFSVILKSASKEMIWKNAQNKFNNVKVDLDKRNRQLDVFVQYVMKKNSNMLDHLIQQKSPKKGRASSKESDNIPKTPISPRPPPSPKPRTPKT